MISADASTGDGLIPSLVLADELHRWRTADLFETLEAALSKRGGRMLTISTAGVREQSCPLWPIRERALETLTVRRDGVRLAADSPDGAFALREFSAPEDSDWRDLDVAADVNPLVTRAALEQRFASPAQNARSWRRFTLNQWLEPAVEEAIIPGDVWSEVAGEFEPLPPACFAVDVAPDRSAACIAVAAFDGSGADRLVGVEVVEHALGVVWVVDRLLKLDARHEHVGVMVDGAGPAGTLIPRLEEFGLEAHVTTGREYARACQAFYDLVAEGRLRHRDQAALNLAVQAASRRRLTDGWAWARSASLGDISPLCAASLAAYGLTVHGPVSEEAFHAIG